MYLRNPINRQFRIQINDESQIIIGGNRPGNNGIGFWWLCWGRFNKKETNYNAEIYYNDSRIGTIGTFNFPIINNDYNWLWIGNKGPTSQGGSSSWDGRFDEVRFSKVYRNNEWMNATYNTIISPDTFMRINVEEHQLN